MATATQMAVPPARAMGTPPGDRMDNLEAKLDLLLEQVTHLNRRAIAMEELGSEGARIAKDALVVMQDELSDVEDQFNSEQLALLTRKLLRSTPRFINLLDTLESVDSLMTEAGPLGKAVLADLVEHLQVAEERGYFRLLQGGMALLDRVATHYTQDDIDKLSDNIVFILDTVKRMTQPEILGTVNQAIEVLDHPGDDVQPLGLWGLMRAMRDPEIQNGVGVLMAVLRQVSRGPHASAANTNETKNQSATEGVKE
jgi:uncharacterized protein YjgD (DUF1641 family)